MADNVEDFLLENAGSPVAEEEIKFKRFKSPFRIKSLTAEDIMDIRKQATRRVLDKQTRQYSNETNQDKYMELLVAASVVSPDLNSERLQKSWGVIAKPEKLLEKMLTAGEYTDLMQRVNDLSGLSVDIETEAKN